MVPEFPPVDCTLECMENELKRVLEQVPFCVAAIFPGESQNDVHEIGHLVASALLAAHGYTRFNFHAEQERFLCRFIQKVPGLEIEGKEHKSV
jgi:methanogenic corrinoid protein MtbC1